MTRSARAIAFEREHGTPQPKPMVDLVLSTDTASSEQLFELVDPAAPPSEHPVDVPERIVLGEDTSAEDAALAALTNVVKTLGMRGRNQGRDMILKTGGNRFITDVDHPYERSDWMDGKEDGLADGNLKDYDVLNNTAARLQAGEDPAEVITSRERLKAILESELKTGAMRKVDLGGRTGEVRVDANYRRKLLADSDATKRLIDSLRLRSR
ncbi:MAG: hypothetical protein JWN26_259 [Candidatus Saccharibacteria bacterium]|nr:hypothetical protein [Candidatus Saccharibacteria bacterium]